MPVPDLRCCRRRHIVPAGLRWLAPSVRALVRRLAYLRLQSLPLNAGAAARWAAIMKRYPAVFNGVPFRRSVVLKDAPRIRMQCGLIDVIERTLTVEGRWEPHVGRLLQAVLKPGAVLLDVGANVGYFSLLASELVGPTGRVFAFEPCTRNFLRLAEHVRANGLANITPLPLAVSSRKGSAVMHFLTPNNAGASTLRPCPQSAGDEAVISFPLDDFFAATGVAPSLVKIDVEGYELEVLRGMRGLLSTYHPFVVAELVEAFLREACGRGPQDVLDYMAELGYRAFVPLPGEPGVCRPYAAARPAVCSGDDDVLFVPPGRECPLVLAPV